MTLYTLNSSQICAKLLINLWTETLSLNVLFHCRIHLLINFMSSSPSSNSPERKSSLADFVQSTVPLSLFARQYTQEGSDEMSHHHEHHPPRVLNVTPSPSQQGTQHPLFGAGAAGSSHPNSKNPQELAQCLREISRDSTFDPNIEGPSVPHLQPRQPINSEQTYQGGRPSSGDLDIISMQEVLKQLDKQAEYVLCYHKMKEICFYFVYFLVAYLF